MSLFYAIVTTLALLLISLSMFLRGHEYNEKGAKAVIRKLGLLSSAVSPIGLVLAIWFELNMAFYLCWFTVGLFLVIFTTPNGVPWHKWVWHGLQEAENRVKKEISELR